MSLLRLAPEAVYDTLHVVNFSTPRGSGVTESELTFFCYLACLLSVYSGEPAGNWGYTFASTKSISPFSSALNEALDVLVRSGRIVRSMDGFAATDSAKRDLDAFGDLQYFSERRRFLRAACNSSLAIPLPAVGFALSHEPALRRALAVSATRELLTDEIGPQALHRHFAVLAEELPDSNDMFLAAVTWIAMLSEDPERLEVQIEHRERAAAPDRTAVEGGESLDAR